jgi:hypothetical protein
LSEICERTSNKITRWPLHITTPRSSTTNSHTTCLDVTWRGCPSTSSGHMRSTFRGVLRQSQGICGRRLKGALQQAQGTCRLSFRALADAGLLSSGFRAADSGYPVCGTTGPPGGSSGRSGSTCSVSSGGSSGRSGSTCGWVWSGLSEEVSGSGMVVHSSSHPTWNPTA